MLMLSMAPLASFIAGAVLTTLLMRCENERFDENVQVDNSETPGEFFLDKIRKLVDARAKLQELCNYPARPFQKSDGFQGFNFCKLMINAREEGTKNLIALRYLYGLNQTDFGNLIGIPQNRMSGFENGMPIPRKRLVQIERVTHFPPYFFDKRFLDTNNSIQIGNLLAYNNLLHSKLALIN